MKKIFKTTSTEVKYLLSLVLLSVSWTLLYVLWIAIQVSQADNISGVDDTFLPLLIISVVPTILILLLSWDLFAERKFVHRLFALLFVVASLFVFYSNFKNLNLFS